ncbi:hypothetical protein [Nitratifractor sp.]
MGQKNVHRIEKPLLFVTPSEPDRFSDALLEIFGKLFVRVIAGTPEEFEHAGSKFQEDAAGVVVECIREDPGRCRNLLDTIEERYVSLPVLVVLPQNEQMAFTDRECPLYAPWDREGLKNQLRPFLAAVRSGNRRVSSVNAEDEHCKDVKRFNDAYEGFFRLEAQEMERLTNELTSMLSVLLQTELNDRQKEYLGVIERIVSQLGSYIGELKRRVGIDLRSIGTAKVSFNINTVLNFLSESIRAKLDGNEGSFFYRIDRSVPSIVIGNPIVLGTILMDLYTLIDKLPESNDHSTILSVRLDNPDGAHKALHFSFELLAQTPEQSESESFPLELFDRLDREALDRIGKWVESIGGTLTHDEKRIEVTIPTERKERRSYRLPSREWMNKRILLAIENALEADIVRSMLSYFHFPITQAISIYELEKYLKEKRFDMIFVDSNTAAKMLGFLVSNKNGAKVIVTMREKRSGNEEHLRQYVDALIEAPYTQGAIFQTILNVFAKDMLEETQESLEILRENVAMLLGGRKLLYVGSEGSDWILIQSLLEDVDVELAMIDREYDAQRLRETIENYEIVFLDSKTLSTRTDAFEGLGDRIIFIAILDDKEQADPNLFRRLGIERWILSPIDPEIFYHTLFETVG